MHDRHRELCGICPSRKKVRLTRSEDGAGVAGGRKSNIPGGNRRISATTENTRVTRRLDGIDGMASLLGNHLD